MKLKIDFSFGVEYRYDGSPLLGYEQTDGIRVIRNRAVELFGAYTQVDTRGNERTAEFAEVGCTVSVFTDLPPILVTERVNAMVDQIKDSLQQASVAVTKTECQFEIV